MRDSSTYKIDNAQKDIPIPKTASAKGNGGRFISERSRPIVWGRSWLENNVGIFSSDCIPPFTMETRESLPADHKWGD
jgi:hypothetical protein